jgi:beta-galactosidase
VWTVDAEGRIDLEMDCQKSPEYTMIPRFGIRMFLNSSLDRVTYCGVGPYESYRDKHHASYYGRFESAVVDLHEDYLRPQENGSHCGCDYVILTGENAKLTVCAKETAFSFNASVYTQEELAEKNHNYELEPSGNTVLCLDYAHNGIGSNSCGPVLDKKYALAEDTFRFAFSFRPEV